MVTAAERQRRPAGKPRKSSSTIKLILMTTSIPRSFSSTLLLVSYWVLTSLRLCHWAPYSQLQMARLKVFSAILKKNKMPSGGRRGLSATSFHLVFTAHLTTVGDQAFAVAAARVWNSLPQHIISAGHFCTFGACLPFTSQDASFYHFYRAMH